MSYTKFAELNQEDFSPEILLEKYNEGYVATRKGKGHLEKIRSLRINLSDFKLSSENRRILRKFETSIFSKPLPYQNYDWRIHKLGKDFYEAKFGANTFSANKIKEILTTNSSQFNNVLEFKKHSQDFADGFCIILDLNFKDFKIIHYAYPFYRLDLINSSFGIYMMTKTVESFYNAQYDYIYLGSVHDSKSLYKLQFEGLEWYDELTSAWSKDIAELKSRCRTTQ